MNIGIFTGRIIDPLHPRIVSYFDFFEKRGLTCQLVPQAKNRILSRINWFSLHFFDLYSVYCHRKKLAFFDVVIIQDLKYLPLARYARKKNKRVIYETLDNNVSLRAYQLCKKLPFLKPLEKSITAYFTRKERCYAFGFCDKIIVNSKALVQYFDDRADLIFYSSSFETIGIKNNVKLNPALLYLGEFSYDKGAAEMMELRNKLGINLFIFGTIQGNSLSEAISGNNMIHHVNRLSHGELSPRIEDLLKIYFLIGTSLIKPVHFSYATQEANKEIDYLAMGIPIIGNHRKPTEEKIIAGCGIFIEDDKGCADVISNEGFRNKLTINCKNYYSMYYSYNHFNKAMSDAFSSFIDKQE